MKIIETLDNIDLGKKRECYWIDFYKNNGWTLINKVKGGSVGSLYTKYSDEFIIKESKKYKTYKEFKKNSKIIYNTALRRNLLPQMPWLENDIIRHTYEECYNAAKECNTRTEFKHKFPLLLSAAENNNWLHLFDWLEKIPSKEDLETLKKEYTELAKKYKTNADFQRDYPTEYHLCYRHGWLKEFTWLKKVNRYSDYETAFEEAKQFHNIDEFQLCSKACYKKCIELNYIEKFTWLFEEENQKIDRISYYSVYENAYNEAQKYKTYTELKENNPVCYTISYQKQFIKKFDWLINDHKKVERIIWTFDKAAEESKKYKTDAEFKIKNPSCYRSCKRQGFLKDFVWLQKTKLRKIESWNYEKAYEIAKKYTKLSEFKKKDLNCFRACELHNYLEKFDWFIDEKPFHRKLRDFDVCYNEAKKYKSLSELKTKDRSLYNSIIKYDFLKDIDFFNDNNE